MTQGNNAEQLPPSQQQHPHWLVTGHARRAQYEEVTLMLLEGNWKSAVSGDFFQPSFHFLSNEVRRTDKGKLVLLSGVTTMLVVQSAFPQINTGVSTAGVTQQNQTKDRNSVQASCIFYLAFTNLSL